MEKHMTIRHCPECDAYLQYQHWYQRSGGTWIKAQPESEELSACCIQLLDLSKSIRVVSSNFIRTRPPSTTIKLRLKIQWKARRPSAEAPTKSFVAEFLQLEKICESCTGVLSEPDHWVASVQLRQHVPHREVLFYLEGLISEHSAAVHAIKINQMDQGIDIYFGKRKHCVEFVEFIAKFSPVKSHIDKQLVSHDTHSHKYTFSVEIPPICLEDLICLPPNIGSSLGNLGPIVICTEVTNKITLLDPLTLRKCYLDADDYWRAPFKPLLTTRQLVEYLVLDVEIIDQEATKRGFYDDLYALAEVRVARLSDFGKNDKVLSLKTHLGHCLKPGDQALGYDLYGVNKSDFELEEHQGLVLPEAILIWENFEQMRRRIREAQVSQHAQVSQRQTRSIPLPDS